MELRRVEPTPHPVRQRVTCGDVLIARDGNWDIPVQTDSTATTTTAAPILTAASAARPLRSRLGARTQIVITLMRGDYNAVLSGVNNTTGAGLVVVYELHHIVQE